MNVLDEMRRKRKINMVLQDAGVDEYIAMDMTEINMYEKEQWQSLDPKVQFAIMDKIEFREQLAQSISITKLDYMLKVIRKVFGKGIISDPDAFKDKIRKMVRAERAAQQGLNRSKTGTSSYYTKSMRSGTASGDSE